MKKCVIIDGIGDYSIVKNFYRFNEPDYNLLVLSDILNQLNTNVIYCDIRDYSFNKKDLYEKLKAEKIDFIILKGSILTIQSIKRLNLEQFSSNIYILANNSAYHTNLYTILNIDEKISIYKNMKLILENLGYSIGNNEFRYSYTHWNFVNYYSGKTISLKIGSGCERGCKFCSIRNSLKIINETDSIIDEIEYLIKTKKIYSFHISNHCLSQDIRDLHKLSTKIIERNLGENYMWSCFIIPESLGNVENETFFDTLVKSCLQRIFIGVEHVNYEILNHFGITYHKENLLKSINCFYRAGISSIVINYIIGSPQESKETLNELILFSDLLLEYAPGVIEFNLSMYCDDTSRELNDEDKLYPNNNSYHLSKYELLEFKQLFYKRMYDKMRKIIPELSLQSRIKHYDLNRVNLKTQYFENFISRTNFAISKNDPFRLNYYSFEISDNILDYSPSSSAIEGYDAQLIPFLPINPLLSETKEYHLILNDIDFFLFKQTKKNISIHEIIKLMVKEKNISEDTAQNIALSFYEKLQHYGLLYYSKLFK